MSSPPALSVIIPCYNEELIIRASIEHAVESVGRFEPSFELLVCNDGSTDRTLEVAAEAAARYDNVSCLTYPKNRGAGAAFRLGLESARGKAVMHMDADLAMEPYDVCRALLPELATHGIAIASRYMGVKADYPLRRRLPSAVFGLMYRTLLGLKIRDAMSGFFAVRRDVLAKVKPLVSDGFEVYLELFLKAKQAGFEFKEIGVEFLHQTVSGETSVLAHGPRQAMNTLRIWKDVRLGRSSR